MVLALDDDVRLGQCPVGIAAVVALVAGNVGRLRGFALAATRGGAVHAQLFLAAVCAQAHDGGIEPHRIELDDLVLRPLGG